MLRLFLHWFAPTFALVFAFCETVVSQQQARILVGPNVLVSRSTDGVSGELKIGVDPTNPEHLIASGILFRTNRQGTSLQNSQETRAYYSHDGGYTWNTVIYPEVNTLGAGDPIVAYGRTGTTYFITMLDDSIDAKTTKTIAYRSEDGGITWSTPLSLGLELDQPKIIVDYTAGRYAGNLYVSVMDAKPSSDGKYDYWIKVYRSSDDGKKWIGPVNIATNQERRARGLMNADPALFTDGEIFMPFFDWPRGTADRTSNAGRFNYWFTISKDGGKTYSVPQKFALDGGGEITWPFFPGHNTVFAIDNSEGPFNNRIYAAWFDSTFSPGYGGEPPNPAARLVISYSSNRGKTWSHPKVVGASGVGQQFGPAAITVNNEGIVAVSWYDTRNTPGGRNNESVDRYLTASIDGGQTFLPSARVSSTSYDYNLIRINLSGAFNYAVRGPDNLPSGPKTIISLAPQMGHEEYLGLASDKNGTFHVVWTDGRSGRYQIWTAPIHVKHDSTRDNKIAVLVEADVSGRIAANFDPLSEFASNDIVELPIRIKNISNKPIYGPITVEVEEITPNGSILNAVNGNTGIGARFDYSRALGDFPSLLPSAITEGVLWRFKKPSNHKEIPRFKIKVTARIEKPKEGTPAKPVAPKQ